MQTIMNQQTADGVSSSVTLAAPTTVDVFGVFDGASLVVEMSLDDINFRPVHQAQYEPGGTNVDGKGTYYLRGRIINAGPLTVLSLVSSV